MKRLLTALLLAGSLVACGTPDQTAESTEQLAGSKTQDVKRKCAKGLLGGGAKSCACPCAEGTVVVSCKNVALCEDVECTCRIPVIDDNPSDTSSTTVVGAR
jgi:hypothetical protein